MRRAEGPAVVKGHGTENDFILLPDPQGHLKLTTARVRALCDRRRGLGADGVLRVVRAGVLGEPVPGIAPETWFMDYRNADGSVAEMCGNGVRVFARYLVDAGWTEAGEQTIGTRHGPRWVRVHPEGEVTVDMGPAMVFGESDTILHGQLFHGVAVDLGNPHLVCLTDQNPRELDFSAPPSYDPDTFPNGVNLEFVRPLDAARVEMRVYERGVGETRSCGTGTVAATVAVLRAAGEHTGRRTVAVPGGVVEVAVTASTTTLTGPAVIVSEGHLDLDWWNRTETD